MDTNYQQEWEAKNKFCQEFYGLCYNELCESLAHTFLNKYRQEISHWAVNHLDISASPVDDDELVTVSITLRQFPERIIKGQIYECTLLLAQQSGDLELLFAEALLVLVRELKLV